MGTSVRESTFSFLGYHLAEIDLTRNPNSIINKVSFEILEFDYSKDDVANLSLLVKLDYTDTLGGFINYRSAFKIHDEVLKDAFLNYGNKEKTQQQELLGGLIAALFPYVRQSISALTSDSGFQIVLPILDARQIAAGGAFVYSEQEE